MKAFALMKKKGEAVVRNDLKSKNVTGIIIIPEPVKPNANDKKTKMRRKIEYGQSSETNKISDRILQNSPPKAVIRGIKFF